VKLLLDENLSRKLFARPDLGVLVLDCG